VSFLLVGGRPFTTSCDFVRYGDEDPGPGDYWRTRETCERRERARPGRRKTAWGRAESRRGYETSPAGLWPMSRTSGFSAPSKPVSRGAVVAWPLPADLTKSPPVIAVEKRRQNCGDGGRISLCGRPGKVCERFRRTFLAAGLPPSTSSPPRPRPTLDVRNVARREPGGNFSNRVESRSSTIRPIDVRFRRPRDTRGRGQPDARLDSEAFKVVEAKRDEALQRRPTAGRRC